MKPRVLINAIVVLNIACFTTPLFADIQSDVSNSLDEQFTPDQEVRYVARDTVVRKNPDPNSEPVLRLKVDKRVFVISKKDQWAEVQPDSNNNLTGFVPLSSLSRTPVEATSSTSAEDNSVEIDLSGVTSKTPQEIALAQSQRIQQEKLVIIKAEEAERREREESRRQAEREKREQERQERLDDEEYERWMAASQSQNDNTHLKRQWERLSQMPSAITRLDSPYDIERERRRALRMKERQSRQQQYQDRPKTRSSNNYGTYSSNSPATSDHSSSDYNSGNSSNNSPKFSDNETVQKKPKSRQKVYEPSPQVITGKTSTAFHDRDDAVAYARLNGDNKIGSQCRDKGARYDSTTFSEIEKGNSAIRTTFANPDCKQQSNDSWKCTAEVRGHCYRIQ